MIMAQEQAILKAQEQFTQVQDFLRQAGGMDQRIEQVELERLRVAAHCFHPEGSDEAKAFVAERLRRLLEGDVGYVIGGLKQMGTKHQLKNSKRQRLAKVITYLENHRSYMRYDVCLAQGYPIGSGVVEGACRHVVKDRMEGTGMRWCIAGAQSMLHLRAIYLDGDWDTFQGYRIEAARRQLYPYRPFVHRLYRKTGYWLSSRRAV